MRAEEKRCVLIEPFLDNATGHCVNYPHISLYTINSIQCELILEYQRKCIMYDFIVILSIQRLIGNFLFFVFAQANYSSKVYVDTIIHYTQLTHIPEKASHNTIKREIKEMLVREIHSLELNLFMCGRHIFPLVSYKRSH